MARDDKHHGFATFEVSREALKGNFRIVAGGGDEIPPEGQIVDTFSYAAKAIYLEPADNIKWAIKAAGDDN